MRVLPLLLGRQGEGRIGALGQRHGQQRGKQRHDFLQGEGIRHEHPFELGEPGGWGIIPRKLEQPFQVHNNRIEGTVRMIGRTVIRHPHHTLPPDVLAHGAH